MPPNAIFNRYDLRGAYPSEINESIAEKLGAATAASLDNMGTVVIGHDTRPHSHIVADALTTGITRNGVTVKHVGLSPTDKVAVCTTEWDADLGIMVTASHHAWERTGCKYIYTEGYGFSNEDMNTIKELYGTTRDVEAAPTNACVKKANKLYREHALTTVQEYLGTSTPQAKVVVDCCTGGTSPFLPQLLRDLGCDVAVRNTGDTPDTTLPPEPTAENRSFMQEALKTEDADIALGTDPDGDRVYAFDKTGDWVTGQELFAILADIINAENITASLDTSALLQEHTDAAITETRVGDVFVAAEAVKQDADMYGEPNGHYAFPRFSWYPSGTLAALLLTSIAHDLPNLRESLPQYATERHTIQCGSNEKKQGHMDAIAAFVTENYDVVSTVDGVKFTVEDGTVLIRPSGTTPKIRCVFEHRDPETAAWMKEIIMDQITTHTPL